MKSVDILQEIINQRSGSHYIRLEDKELLNEELKILHDDLIFDKYKMSYVYRELEDSILLVIHKSLYELIQY
ncbi:MAG: hypothetical protein ACLUBI_12570 [Clostridium sp.]|uniref:hypothetical protein n=1 Tax=Clostridium sp. TaxID=1506 RepID=UPI0039929C26